MPSKRWPKARAIPVVTECFHSFPVRCHRKNVKFDWILSRAIIAFHSNMSLVMRKPVFGVSNQVRLKSACSATEASLSHELVNIETKDRQRTTKGYLSAIHICDWSLFSKFGITKGISNMLFFPTVKSYHLLLILQHGKALHSLKLMVLLHHSFICSASNIRSCILKQFHAMSFPS